MTDPHGVRERFDEARLVPWNHVRTFASIVIEDLMQTPTPNTLSKAARIMTGMPPGEAVVENLAERVHIQSWRGKRARFQSGPARDTAPYGVFVSGW